MSTPQHQPAARALRRSGKKPRPAEHQDGTVSSSSIPQEKTSPNATLNNNSRNNNKGQGRRPSHAPNQQPTDGNASDRAKYNPGQLEKARATPVKQAAYAGSTFQQSPAASALPLPSFYSKSLPNTTSMPDSASKQPTPPLPTSGTPADDSPSKRESTPLDFLFEAARQATISPRSATSATRSGALSVPAGSPASRSPAPREGDSVFPFELEGGSVPGEDGSSFATPYKDRMAAVRSTRSNSQGVKSMDESERKAKSEALKKLLMKSGGPDNNQNRDSGHDANNPFNARAPYQPNGFAPHVAPPIRPNSNPSQPFYAQHHEDYNPPQGFPKMSYHYSTVPQQITQGPTSSSLRNVYQSEPEYAELSSDNAIKSPISTARRQSTQQSHQRYSMGHASQPYSPQPQVPTHRSKPSAQQLEDDLRRVLKLDLTSRG